MGGGVGLVNANSKHERDWMRIVRGPKELAHCCTTEVQLFYTLIPLIKCRESSLDSNEKEADHDTEGMTSNSQPAPHIRQL